LLWPIGIGGKLGYTQILVFNGSKEIFYPALILGGGGGVVVVIINIIFKNVISIKILKFKMRNITTVNYVNICMCICS